MELPFQNQQSQSMHQVCICFINKTEEWDSECYHLPLVEKFSNNMFFYLLKRFFEQTTSEDGKYAVEMDIESRECEKIALNVDSSFFLERIQMYNTFECIRDQGYMDENIQHLWDELMHKTLEEITENNCLFCEINFPCTGKHSGIHFLIGTFMIPDKWIPFGKDLVLFPMRNCKVNQSIPSYNVKKGYLLNRSSRHLWEVKVTPTNIEEPVRIDPLYPVLTDFLLTSSLLKKNNMASQCMKQIYEHQRLDRLEKNKVPPLFQDKIQDVYRTCHSFNWCCSWKIGIQNCCRGKARNLLGLTCKRPETDLVTPMHEGHFHRREHPSSEEDLWFEGRVISTSFEQFHEDLDQAQNDYFQNYRVELLETYELLKSNASSFLNLLDCMTPVDVDEKIEDVRFELNHLLRMINMQLGFDVNQGLVEAEMEIIHLSQEEEQDQGVLIPRFISEAVENPEDPDPDFIREAVGVIEIVPEENEDEAVEEEVIEGGAVGGAVGEAVGEAAGGAVGGGENLQDLDWDSHLDRALTRMDERSPGLVSHFGSIIDVLTLQDELDKIKEMYDKLVKVKETVLEKAHQNAMATINVSTD